MMLQKEIKALEKDIKSLEEKNKRIKFIRNLEIGRKVGCFVFPYVVSAGLIFEGIWVATGKVPFIIDDVKEYLYTQTEIDSLGNERILKKYGEFQNITDYVTYYTKWEDMGGDYTRCIKTYSLGKFDYKKALSWLEEDNILLDEILGEPMEVMWEKKEELTREELSQDEYIKIVLYKRDKKDSIIVKEYFGENILWSLLDILLTGMSFVLIKNVQEDVFDYKLKEKIEEVLRSYTFKDGTLLRKRLEIRKENYDRLIR